MVTKWSLTTIQWVWMVSKNLLRPSKYWYGYWNWCRAMACFYSRYTSLSLHGSETKSPQVYFSPSSKEHKVRNNSVRIQVDTVLVLIVETTCWTSIDCTRPFLWQQKQYGFYCWVVVDVDGVGVFLCAHVRTVKRSDFTRCNVSGLLVIALQFSSVRIECTKDWKWHVLSGSVQ